LSYEVINLIPREVQKNFTSWVGRCNEKYITPVLYYV
jgi:hypothetical protein